MFFSILKNYFYEWLPNKWLIRSGPRNRKNIYLTFDDGPNGEYTIHLLKILRDRNIKASFFVVGDYVQKNNNILHDIEQEGHDIFNHSYKHWEFDSYSTAEKINDLAKLDALLPRCKNSKSIPFRPPCGKLDLPLLLRLILEKRQIIYWSVDSMDYMKAGEKYLLDHFEKNPVIAGDIILFHDDNLFTVNALPKLLDKWIQADFDILPISKLILN